MSDLDLIQMLLSDPLVTQSDIEIFKHQPGKSAADELTHQFPMRPLSRAFQEATQIVACRPLRYRIDAVD